MNRLFIVLLLAACQGCSLRLPAASISLQNLEAPARVWLLHDTAVVQFELPGGKYLYAAAGWEPGPVVKLDFEHILATLEPVDDDWPQGLPGRREFTELKVLKAEYWNDILGQVMDQMLPKEPFQGLFLLVQRRSYVAYRDAEGKLQLKSSDEVPEEVTIVVSHDQPAFLEKVGSTVEAALAQSHPGVRRLLFRTSSLSHPGQQFILLDLDGRQVVSLNSPLPTEGGDPLGLLGLPVRGAASIIFRSHVLTLVKNPVTTISRLVNLAVTTTVSFVRPLPPGNDGELAPLNTGPGMDLVQWERDLDEIAAAPSYAGQLALLIDGEAFFQALIEDLNNAQSRIDFRVYIFDSDDYAVTIAELLRSRSNDVDVQVLVDDLGTLGAGTLHPDSLPPNFVPPESIVAFLEQDSDVSVRRSTNPWLTADHTKLYLIDETVAYTGGMNLGREYRYEWHDLMVRMEGPIVARLQQDFDEAWAHAGIGGDLAYGLTAASDPDIPPAEIPDVVQIRPLYTGTASAEILNAQLAAMARSQKYIYLENAYLSDNSIIAALVEARSRGVDVRVVLPTVNDSDIMAAANIASANVLLSYGVRVYVYPGMTHVKAAIYDGWACLGSANFDKLSLYINQEMNIGFSDPAAVQQLKRDLFERDFEIATEITEPIEPGWSDFLFDTLANLL